MRGITLLAALGARDQGQGAHTGLLGPVLRLIPFPHASRCLCSLSGAERRPGRSVVAGPPDLLRHGTGQRDQPARGGGEWLLRSRCRGGQLPGAGSRAPGQSGRCRRRYRCCRGAAQAHHPSGPPPWCPQAWRAAGPTSAAARRASAARRPAPPPASASSPAAAPRAPAPCCSQTSPCPWRHRPAPAARAWPPAPAPSAAPSWASAPISAASGPWIPSTAGHRPSAGVSGGGECARGRCPLRCPAALRGGGALPAAQPCWFVALH